MSGSRPDSKASLCLRALPGGDPDPALEGGDLRALRRDILGCRLCRDAPHGPAMAHDPRPILRLSSSARLVIASQAPGIRAHTSGVPFKDASGERLRDWMGLDEARFYDASRVAIVPMGFCFPGHDAHGGDLPPRRECRLVWHARVFAALPQIETILAVGLFAIRYHAERLVPERPRIQDLGAALSEWRLLFERPAPRILPLPHPSWRNRGWIKRNPLFEAEVLPVLRHEVDRLVRCEPSSPVRDAAPDGGDAQVLQAGS